MKILPQQMPRQGANNISREVWSRHATDKEDLERQQQTLKNSQMINCKDWMTPCPILKAQGLPGSWRPHREVSIPAGANVSDKKRTSNFWRIMPNLAGHFSILSQAQNEDLKAPLESLGVVDVDRLFKLVKRIFYDREIWFLKNLPFHQLIHRKFAS